MRDYVASNGTEKRAISNIDTLKELTALPEYMLYSEDANDINMCFPSIEWQGAERFNSYYEYNRFSCNNGWRFKYLGMPCGEYDIVLETILRQHDVIAYGKYAKQMRKPYRLVSGNLHRDLKGPDGNYGRVNRQLSYYSFDRPLKLFPALQDFKLTHNLDLSYAGLSDFNFHIAEKITEVVSASSQCFDGIVYHSRVSPGQNVILFEQRCGNAFIQNSTSYDLMRDAEGRSRIEKSSETRVAISNKQVVTWKQLEFVD